MRFISVVTHSSKLNYGNLSKKYNRAHTNTIRSTFILVSLVCRRVRWPELWPRCRNRTPLISNHFAGSPIHYAITRRDGLCVRSGTRRSAGPTTAMAAARTSSATTARSRNVQHSVVHTAVAKEAAPPAPSERCWSLVRS